MNGVQTEFCMSKESSNSDKSMNKDLREWIRETKHTFTRIKEEGVQHTKRPLGKCSICKNNRAQFICLKCGQSVCPSCYYTLIGICKTCIPTEIAEKWDRTHPHREKQRNEEWIF